MDEKTGKPGAWALELAAGAGDHRACTATREPAIRFRDLHPMKGMRAADSSCRRCPGGKNVIRAEAKDENE
jgi:hypothetical protein